MHLSCWYTMWAGIFCSMHALCLFFFFHVSSFSLPTLLLFLFRASIISGHKHCFDTKDMFSTLFLQTPDSKIKVFCCSHHYVSPHWNFCLCKHGLKEKLKPFYSVLYRLNYNRWCVIFGFSEYHKMCFLYRRDLPHCPHLIWLKARLCIDFGMHVSVAFVQHLVVSCVFPCVF